MLARPHWAEKETKIQRPGISQKLLHCHLLIFEFGAGSLQSAGVVWRSIHQERGWDNVRYAAHEYKWFYSREIASECRAALKLTPKWSILYYKIKLHPFGSEKNAYCPHLKCGDNCMPHYSSCVISGHIQHLAQWQLRVCLKQRLSCKRHRAYSRRSR